MTQANVRSKKNGLQPGNMKQAVYFPVVGFEARVLVLDKVKRLDGSRKKRTLRFNHLCFESVRFHLVFSWLAI